MKGVLFFISLLFFISSFAQQRVVKEGDAMAVLNTIDGKSFSMSESKKYFATVFVFLLPDCPASQNYSLTLNKFAEKYKQSNIQFYGVFPAFVKKEDVLKFKKEYHLEFPILLDDKNSLMKVLQAHIAPEVFVLDEKLNIKYSGRIDNWMYAVGRTRTVVTTHELQDALEAMVDGKKIVVAKTKAVGCIID